MLRAGILSALLVGVSLLAGCVHVDPVADPAADPPDVDESPGMTPNETAGGHSPVTADFYVHNTGMFVFNATPGTWINITQSPEEHKEAVNECRNGLVSEDREKIAYVPINLLNRTGIVYQSYERFDEETPFRQQIKVPNDPPFLLNIGGKCMRWLQVDVVADWWVMTPSDTNYPGTTNGTVGEFEWQDEVVNVTVAAGQTFGYATVPVGSRIATMYNPFLGGNVHPAPLSDGWARLYEPGIDPATSDWNNEVRWLLGDSTPDIRRQSDLLAGDWVVEVELMAPALQETTWSVELIVVLWVPENLEALGFAQPFEVYAPAPVRTPNPV